jgi:hypothetical protein
MQALALAGTAAVGDGRVEMVGGGRGGGVARCASQALPAALKAIIEFSKVTISGQWEVMEVEVFLLHKLL